MSPLKTIEINLLEGKVIYTLKAVQKLIEQAILRHQGIKSLEKNRMESIRIESRKDLISLNLFLIFDLERRAPEIAWELQKSLKEVVERKTGLKVDRINIYVQGFEAQGKEHRFSLDIPR